MPPAVPPLPPPTVRSLPRRSTSSGRPPRPAPSRMRRADRTDPVTARRTDSPPLLAPQRPHPSGTPSDPPGPGSRTGHVRSPISSARTRAARSRSRRRSRDRTVAETGPHRRAARGRRPTGRCSTRPPHGSAPRRGRPDRPGARSRPRPRVTLRRPVPLDLPPAGSDDVRSRRVACADPRRARRTGAGPPAHGTPTPPGRGRAGDPPPPATDVESSLFNSTQRDLLAQLQEELAARERRPRPYRRAHTDADPAVNGHGVNGHGADGHGSQRARGRRAGAERTGPTDTARMGADERSRERPPRRPPPDVSS